jgi:hypothetical protein
LFPTPLDARLQLQRGKKSVPSVNSGLVERSVYGRRERRAMTKEISASCPLLLRAASQRSGYRSRMRAPNRDRDSQEEWKEHEREWEGSRVEWSGSECEGVRVVKE